LLNLLEVEAETFLTLEVAVVHQVVALVVVEVAEQPEELEMLEVIHQQRELMEVEVQMGLMVLEAEVEVLHNLDKHLTQTPQLEELVEMEVLLI
jgi:hypothetical protein